MLLLRAKELGLVPWGISFHVGSQALNPLAWSNAIESLQLIFEELQENGIHIEILNIGGGFPHAYPSSPEIADLAEIAGSVYAACEKLPIQPRLMLEPGRALVADSAVLVVSVIAKLERNGSN